MENNQKICAAFVKAQSQFGAALKTSTNPHFKSRYADLAAVVEAVIDALNKNGIGMMQQTFECENGVIVETVFIHESGEELRSGKLHVPASKHDAQGYGSALTYARRYSLLTATGIAPEDDDGNAATQQKPKPIGALPEKVFADLKIAIDDSLNMQSLQSAFALAYKAASAANDKPAVDTFTKIYNARKLAIQGAE